MYKRKDETKNNDIYMNKKWDAKMINKILKDRIYVGDLIQGKRKVENYRTHKLINTKEDEWIITQNHHEQIITEDKFNEVQEMLKKNKCARSNKEKIKTITRDVLMKNIDEIIIYENKEIKVKFK